MCGSHLVSSPCGADRTISDAFPEGPRETPTNDSYVEFIQSVGVVSGRGPPRRASSKRVIPGRTPSISSEAAGRTSPGGSGNVSTQISYEQQETFVRRGARLESLSQLDFCPFWKQVLPEKATRPR